MADELQLNRTFDDTSDGVDMDVPASVVTSETVYTGAIFSVEDRRVALTRNDGGTTTIRRQVIHHAPCVVMLVHDTVRDTYLVEREYRAGSNMYAVGLPAGLKFDSKTGVISGAPTKVSQFDARAGAVKPMVVTVVAASKAKWVCSKFNRALMQLMQFVMQQMQCSLQMHR